MLGFNDRLDTRIRVHANYASGRDVRIYAIDEDTAYGEIWFSRRIGPIDGYPFPLPNPSKESTIGSVTKQSTCLRNQSNPTIRYHDDDACFQVTVRTKPITLWAECTLASPRGTAVDWKADEDADCLKEFRRQLADSLLDKCKFTRSYFETALWSSTYDECDDDGDVVSECIPFDVNFDAGDLALETVISGYLDCQRFMQANEADLDASDDDDGRCGHNFWLSRNGHGAGFFDRCDEIGNRLQLATKPYGEVCLYTGDDGRVYSSDDADVLGATWGSTFIDLSLLTS